MQAVERMRMRKTSSLPGTLVPQRLAGRSDSTTAAIDALSRFIGEGLARGETVLAVIRPEHWLLALERLGARGCTVSRAVARGQLMVLDAADTLASCVRNGLPDATAFDEAVGNLVRRLASAATGLRIYGEMVDLLVDQGNVRGAARLDELWADLTARCTAPSGPS